MKLAFSTLIIIFLLFPGIAFRYGYLKRDGLQILTKTKFYIEFLFAFTISIVVHLSSLIFYEEIFKFDFDSNLLFQIIVSNETPDLETNRAKIMLFLAYNVFISTFLFLIGWGLNSLITHYDYEFPKNFQFLDYTGNWDRIFTFNRTQEEKEIFPIVDALINIGDKHILYTGILVQYYIDDKGYIDKLILTNASRLEYQKFDPNLINSPSVDPSTNPQKNKVTTNREKELTPSDEKELDVFFNNVVSSAYAKTSGYIEIKPSHHFVIYGTTIKNLNIRYESS